jgi:hypothetical protein
VARQVEDDVSTVVHPPHSSTARSCVVDGAWATAFFLDLASRRDRVVAQVHTHPGRWVEHSDLDDRHVLVPVEGFISIVIPDFARGNAPDGWGVWRLAADGSWAHATREVAWSSATA